ncbi:MAG: hypothetical protein ACOYN0_01340 [Phycisphaerales bacterium]
MAWIFPLTLWFFASFFLLGDYGWWNDDYFFNQRDAETGQYDSTFLTRRQPEFPPQDRLLPWRPIHMTATPTLITVFWDRPWVVHLVGALLHLTCAGALFLLMRRLRLSVQSAACAVCIHLAHPSHYEAVLWAAAYVATASSAALFLGLTLMVEYGRTGRHLLGLGAPLLTVVLVGCYEQPSACVPLFAFAYAAGAANRADGWRPTWRDARLAMWPTVASLAIVIAYSLNVRYNSPPGLGSDEGSYVAAKDLLDRVQQVLRGMRRLAVVNRQPWGELILGLRSLFLHTGRAVLMLGALGAGAVVAWHACFRTKPFEGISRKTTLRAGVAAGVIGVLGVIGACVPLAVITGYMANPRTFYLVSAFGALAAAGLADLLGTTIERISWAAAPTRALAAGAVILLSTAGGLMYVGHQQRYAQVHEVGVDQAQQLRALAPEPPQDAVMLPLANYSRAVNTGVPGFDRGLYEAWEYSWQSWFFLENIYGRKDVHGFFCNGPDGRGCVFGVSTTHVILEWTMSLPDKAEEGRNTCVPIPLERVVPFVIDPAGKVRIVTTLRVAPMDGGLPFNVLPGYPQVLLDQRRVPPLEFTWPAPREWPQAR